MPPSCSKVVTIRRQRNVMGLMPVDETVDFDVDIKRGWKAGVCQPIAAESSHKGSWLVARVPCVQTERDAPLPSLLLASTWYLV